MANEQTPSNSSKTILIACFLPHGLYLDIMDKSGLNVIARHKLTGNAGFMFPNPKRKSKNPRLTGDAEGPTLNPVPEDHWEAWKKLHADHPAITGPAPAVFAVKNRDSGVAQATEMLKHDFGFNKSDPENYELKTYDENSSIPS